MDSRCRSDFGGVWGEGIGNIPVNVKGVQLVSDIAAGAGLPSACVKSVSVSEREGELEMEEGRPVAQKKNTDTNSPHHSITEMRWN